MFPREPFSSFPPENMKILFLDVDGVLNCEYTFKKSRKDGEIMGLDPYMVLLVDRIVQATGCKVVLSSSWRYDEKSKEIVMKAVPFVDITPMSKGLHVRGWEIKAWLEAHPEVEKYAILDDNDDMLTEQLPNFFKCAWNTGLTDEIAGKVIKHLE